ncbi:MAG: helix-turn-helix transcriptional regulator [Planctomycetota bacterium]|jgi:AraC-like DNA-binding protein
MSSFDIPEKYLNPKYRSFPVHIDGQAHIIGCGIRPKRIPSEENTAFYYEHIFPVVYILNGTGHYTDVNGLSLPLQAGDLILRIPFLHHSSIPDIGSDWLEVHMDLPVSNYETLYHYGAIHPSRPIWTPGVHRKMLNQFLELIQCFDDRLDAIQIIHKMNSILLELQRLDGIQTKTNPTHSIILSACDELKKPANYHLEIKDLAVSLNIGYELFRKLFKREMGLSPGNYRIKSRLDHACRLLTNTEDSISEITEILHYPSIYAFSRSFKSQTGHSPRQFRSLYKES